LQAGHAPGLDRLILLALSPYASQFQGTDLEHASLEGCRVMLADLRDTRLLRCRFAHLIGIDAILFSPREPHNQPAIRAALARARLDDVTGLDLRGTNLAGFTFSGRIREVDFGGADLSGSRFSRARLQACRFDRDTLLSRVRFDECIIEDCDLRSAELTDSCLVRARLEAVNASRARFERCNLLRAELNGGQLRDSIFEHCDLRRSKLDRGVDIKGLTVRHSSCDGMALLDWLGDDQVRGQSLSCTHLYLHGQRIPTDGQADCVAELLDELSQRGARRSPPE
ncbi:MAG: pentapeptide repeat-containing protein, partial [Gammaproteobacteria bacterium]|nr:pentapeptide repeat-containing protein [Gammaproteobacteria bacterium]